MEFKMLHFALRSIVGLEWKLHRIQKSAPQDIRQQNCKLNPECNKTSCTCSSYPPKVTVLRKK